MAAIGTIARSKIYPEEKVKLLPNVGHINNSSVEKILSFSPDLVLINAISPKLGDTLKPFNIPYIVVEANSFNDILNNIKLYGKLTGNEENADLLYNKSIEKLNNIKSKITAQPLNMKGTVLYSTSPMMAFNSKSLPGQILSLLGIENLADNLVGDKPIISPEFLLQQNPDFLAGAMSISKPEDILNSNIIVKETTAGKNNNLFIVDSTKILRGSPRIFEAVEELYKELENLKNN
nr:ABC transporter substrate-binding protein [uncultured Fusobacterium sp.]